MSIKLMTAAWDLNMPHGPKFVLLSLCDQANDAGECFPSIETIAQRCSMGERTVQGHVKALEDAGFLARSERLGRSTIYKLNPRKICTPADSAPPQKTAETPADSAPAPADSAPITTTYPSKEPSKNKTADALTRPAGVSDQVWADFLAIRKAKRAPLTATALDGIKSEATKAGMALADVLTLCCTRGWQSFNAEWIESAKANSPARKVPARENFETIDYGNGIRAL